MTRPGVLQATDMLCGPRSENPPAGMQELPARVEASCVVLCFPPSSSSRFRSPSPSPSLPIPGETEPVRLRAVGARHPARGRPRLRDQRWFTPVKDTATRRWSRTRSSTSPKDRNDSARPGNPGRAALLCVRSLACGQLAEEASPHLKFMPTEKKFTSEPRSSSAGMMW